MMRRKEREVTDAAKIKAFIEKSECCRLGFWDGKEIYIVPLDFGYEETDGIYTLYFHGTKEGRRGSLVPNDYPVTFEMDGGHDAFGGDEACDYSTRYYSVMGTGTIERLEEIEEKKHGLGKIMKHVTGKEEWEYQEKMLHIVDVLQLRVQTMSCKERV